jgi:hypothetical protein
MQSVIAVAFDQGRRTAEMVLNAMMLNLLPRGANFKSERPRSSLDHLVSACDQGPRHLDAEGFGR